MVGKLLIAYLRCPNDLINGDAMQQENCTCGNPEPKTLKPHEP